MIANAVLGSMHTISKECSTPDPFFRCSVTLKLHRSDKRSSITWEDKFLANSNAFSSATSENLICVAFFQLQFLQQQKLPVSGTTVDLQLFVCRLTGEFILYLFIWFCFNWPIVRLSAKPLVPCLTDNWRSTVVV